MPDPLSGGYKIPTGVHYYSDTSGWTIVRINYDNPEDPITAVQKKNPGEVLTCEPHTLLMEMVNDICLFGTEATETEYLAIANPT